MGPKKTVSSVEKEIFLLRVKGKRKTRVFYCAQKKEEKRKRTRLSSFTGKGWVEKSPTREKGRKRLSELGEGDGKKGQHSTILGKKIF